MLEQYPEGLVACVSDSYDILSACSHKWGAELKQQILERKGTLVVRPDSGPPPLMDLRILELLGAASAFNAQPNDKGFLVLPSQIRVIQGDGIDYESLTRICALLVEQKWSIDNIAFGSGGGLLQKLNRDTQKVAFKCSLAVVDGKEIAVYKNPIHAPGKKSKQGRMTVNRVDGKLVTLCGEARDETTDVLVTVFQNGRLTREFSWAEVKANAAVSVDDISQWGPEVALKSAAALAQYRASTSYLQDVEEMKVAEPNYKGPYSN
jgi:nicotinamide phosphoribosyltransferase